jgi:hypothetical protein
MTASSTLRSLLTLALAALASGTAQRAFADPVSQHAIEGAAIATLTIPGYDIATGKGRVWVRGTRILLTAVDPTSNSISAVYGPPSGAVPCV